MKDRSGNMDKNSETYQSLRLQMVEIQLQGRDIRSSIVLEAMRHVPRHEFVLAGYEKKAYGDTPLPIGKGQTISQPYIVALMTEKLGVREKQKILEIGTGSGYQAAVLAELKADVYSIEIVEDLGKRAERILKRLKYNVKVKIGDGYQGWPEHAPFDAIIVTAAAPRIPEPLIAQLKIGGKMIIPIDSGYQDLLLITKTQGGLVKEIVAPVLFVPMIGEIEHKKK
jgi:protein-L-isoaspartate(D-aspartate) O-methyltransferase